MNRAAFLLLFLPIFSYAATPRIIDGKGLDKTDTSAININFENIDTELSGVVHKASTETITGVKHFTGPVSFASISVTTITVSAASAVNTTFRNRVINGNFIVNQRAVSSATNDVYNLDRWYALTQTSSVTISQQSLQENGQTTNLREGQPGTSAQRIGIAQIIESRNIQDLRGEDIVLTARIRSSASQAIRYAIIETTGTADTVTSDIVKDWTSGSYAAGGFFLSTTVITGAAATTPSAATWTAISLTGTLTANANNVIVMFWTEGTFAQNATLDIGLVQLEQGDTNTAWEFRPFGTELSLCQRYYAKTFPLGTAPAQNASTIGAHSFAQAAPAASPGVHLGTWRFPVPMRITPSVTLYNPSAANAQGRNIDAGADLANTTATNQSTEGTAFKGDTPGGTSVGQTIMIHATADAEL